MHDVLIAGAGLTGLSCAFHLLNLGFEADRVELLDARQELGSPNRSPGLILNTTRCDHLLTSLDNEQLQLRNLGENRSSLRREWLEKSLCIHLTRAGVSIGLKRRIDSYEFIQRGIALSINQGKLSIVIEGQGILVDALGSKPPSSGFPGDSSILKKIDNNVVVRPLPCREMRTWIGTLNPTNDARVELSTTHTSFPRNDGLREEWRRDSHTTQILTGEWTEIMITHHPPNIDEFSVDVTIDRGVNLAESVLSSPLLSKT